MSTNLSGFTDNNRTKTLPPRPREGFKTRVWPNQRANLQPARSCHRDADQARLETWWCRRGVLMAWKGVGRRRHVTARGAGPTVPRARLSRSRNAKRLPFMPTACATCCPT